MQIPSSAIAAAAVIAVLPSGWDLGAAASYLLADPDFGQLPALTRIAFDGKFNQFRFKNRGKSLVVILVLGENCSHGPTSEKSAEMYPMEREILVIDGDETARALIEHTLVGEGFAVTAVTDGSTALRQTRTKPFALVVAEIRLPGTLDGFATVRQARALQPRLKCLFTSRFAPAAPWCSDELDEFIAKPFHRRELLGCVFELLERDGAPGSAAADHLGYSYA